MLTVFRNGTLVNNETTSNDISVYFSFLINSLGIFLYVQLHQKLNWNWNWNFTYVLMINRKFDFSKHFVLFLVDHFQFQSTSRCAYLDKFLFYITVKLRFHLYYISGKASAYFITRNGF